MIGTYSSGLERQYGAALDLHLAETQALAEREAIQNERSRSLGSTATVPYITCSLLQPTSVLPTHAVR